MEIIYKEKGSGKTEELVKLSHQHNYYMVVSSKDEANRVQNEAKRKGYNIPLPIAYYEFISGRYNGKGVEKLLIDNVDQLITYLANCPVEAITLTKV